MANCEECIYCEWTGEYQDTGHKAYDDWECTKRTRISEHTNFPFAETHCKYFCIDFWHSEFANEVNANNESLDIAMEKWKQKYCK